MVGSVNSNALKEIAEGKEADLSLDGGMLNQFENDGNFSGDNEEEEKKEEEHEDQLFDNRTSPEILARVVRNFAIAKQRDRGEFSHDDYILNPAMRFHD